MQLLVHAEVQVELTSMMLQQIPDESKPKIEIILRLVIYLKKRGANCSWLLDVLNTYTAGVPCSETCAL